MLLASGLALLTKAGVEIPAAVIIGVAAALAARCAYFVLRGPRPLQTHPDRED